ncbi:MAG TPA: hypothetical protein DIS85_11110 [Vagococcus sp.]|nr:hypothetical protein [Vagococcus sp.]
MENVFMVFKIKSIGVGKMSLLDQKEDRYIELLHGEEISLQDMSESFKDCWLHDGSVKINRETIGLFNIASKDHQYQSLVLSSQETPTVTRVKTKDLVVKSREETDFCFDINKKVIEEIFNKQIYKFPEIEPNFLFIPLEGPSQGNVSYINFTKLNDLRALSGHETVLSFCNHLEIIVPQRFQSLERHLERSFEYYTVVTYFSDSFSEHRETLSFLTNWEGNYPSLKKELVGKALQRTSKNDYRRLTAKHQTKELFSSEEDTLAMADFFLIYRHAL